MKNFLFFSFFFCLCCNSSYSQTDLNLGTGIFEGEPNLAVNPLNSQNIVVAWMHVTTTNRSIRTRTTLDGGLTWSPNLDIQHTFTNYADPAMAFDNSGNLYLCFINHSDGPPVVGGVYSIKSIDGGLTWGGIQEVINVDDDPGHQPIDRPWLVCDRSGGPYDGNLYFTSKTVIGTPAPYRPYFVRSTDGAQSWSNWRYLDTTNWMSGIPTAMVLPSVDADGNFRGIYSSYVPSQSPLPKFLMVSSSDGGTSFTHSQVIPFIPGAASNDSAKISWQMAANPFDADHFALFFVQGLSGDMDILMTETTNGGATWSSVARLNDDPVGNGIMQDLVWASFDNDGDLVVCWRDRRNSNGVGYARPTEIYGTVRWKDSVNFSPNFVISDQSANFMNILAEAGNDFLSQQVVNDTLNVAWGETRTGFLNIWFDRIDLKTGNSVGLTKLANVEVPFVEIYPNPASDEVEIDLDEKQLKQVKVIDVNGQLIFETKSSKFYVGNWPAGVYFVKVEFEGGVNTLKLVKQ